VGPLPVEEPPVDTVKNVDERIRRPRQPTVETSPRTEGDPRNRLVARRVLRLLAATVAFLLISIASIAFALQVTPDQAVTALGQTIAVGAASPSLSASGPGEVVLFGQSLPTAVAFPGPVRPRLVLTEITVNEQVAGLLGSERAEAAATLGEQLARGWLRYFAWEAGFVAFGAFLLLGAIAGWRRFDGQRTARFLIVGVLFVEAVNLAAVLLTAFTAPDILREVHSMSELVGREERGPVAAAPGPSQPQVQAIVLGDSTAAGVGGPELEDATEADRACDRSAFAFAVTLARVNDWNVLNLACSGATVTNGILGPQQIGSTSVAPQLAVAKRAVDAEVAVVNIGANDLRWSTMVRLCAATDACDDRAQTAYFQRSLDRFTSDYFDLLRQLGDLPGDPLVLINQYYEPFEPDDECLSDSGLTTEKIEVLLDRLGALNAVIANGAETFGYATVQPDFTGHGLCSDQPYVQSEGDDAPLHPNARGHLAIALDDERQLLSSS
jgi:lysophospholipase L1-like esterase